MALPFSVQGGVEKAQVNLSVGLVSGTEFRVPGQAVRATFGLGTLSRPLAAARAAIAARHANETPGARLVTLAAGPMSPALASRAQTILDEEDALTNIHRLPTLALERPEPAVTESVVVDEAAILAEHRAAARTGLRWFDVTKRREAARSATALAAHDIDEAMSAVSEAAEAEQRSLDEWWDSLRGNDARVVTEHLSRTFAERDLPATVLAVHGSYAEIAVLAPDVHLLPGDAVSLLSGRGLSIRRAPAQHKARLFRQMVAGVVIAVVRQAFAASPGMDTVRVVVLKAAHRGRGEDLSAIAVVELGRKELSEANLSHDAEALLGRYGSSLHWDVHEIAGTLRPLLLEDVPEVAELLAMLCSGGYLDSEPAPVALA